jgi:ABC-2 type transport system permease protein
MLKNILSTKNRTLLKEMVRSDFKLRYQGSVLGYLWSLLRPLMMFGILYVVFTHVIKVGNTIPFYAQWLLLGLVMWTFFVEATMSGLNAIVGRGDLIRKVNIPKYIIVVSTTTSAFINFLINMLIVFVFMYFGHVPLHWTILLTPLLIIELVMFAMACSFLLAALFVKFRDFSHIWEVALQLLFYGSPILYQLTFWPVRVQKIVSLNPLAQIFQDARALMITPVTVTTKEVYGSWWGRIIPFMMVVVLMVVASWYFRKTSQKFAEEL